MVMPTFTLGLEVLLSWLLLVVGDAVVLFGTVVWLTAAAAAVAAVLLSGAIWCAAAVLPLAVAAGALGKVPAATCSC